ncbi:MAG: M14 family zinc carboxypeptidase, partial [Thermoleophilaceae bacterium]
MREGATDSRPHRMGAYTAVWVALALVLAGGAHAAPVTPLPPTSKTVSIARAASTSCGGGLLAGRAGVSVTRWTATDDGSVDIRLAGDERNDWDLALFDAASGRKLDASLAPGANEVVQTLVRKGQTLLVQACRESGKSSSEPLRIAPVAVPLAPAGTRQAAPTQSLVAIPINSGTEVAALEGLGLNLDEAPNNGQAIAVLSSPAQAAALTRAGYTYRTLIPDMAAAESRYRAADVQAAAAAPSALPTGRSTYRHYTDIQADLKKIVSSHPGLARSLVLPKKSFQGRDIEGIEVTDDVGANDDGKPTFWLMGVHHAREWPSAEIPVEFGYYLVNSFGTDPRVTALLKKVRIVITPVINPDGYITSRESTDPADLSGDPGAAPSLAESVAPPGG